MLRKGPPKPYVAKVTMGKFGIRKEFLEGVKDIRFSNSVGSRGSRLLFHLETGTAYEINEVTSWNHFQRFWTVPDAGGHLPRMQTKEIIEWLRNNS